MLKQQWFNWASRYNSENLLNGMAPTLETYGGLLEHIRKKTLGALWFAWNGRVYRNCMIKQRYQTPQIWSIAYQVCATGSINFITDARDIKSWATSQLQTGSAWGSIARRSKQQINSRPAVETQSLEHLSLFDNKKDHLKG